MGGTIANTIRLPGDQGGPAGRRRPRHAIEKSGVRVFELEYGDRFAEHVAAFDPDFFKVRVRYNPDDSVAVRDT